MTKAKPVKLHQTPRHREPNDSLGPLVLSISVKVVISVEVGKANAVAASPCKGIEVR